MDREGADTGADTPRDMLTLPPEGPMHRVPK